MEWDDLWPRASQAGAIFYALGAWRNALSKCAEGFSISNELQAVTHVPPCHAKTSITRYIAGCFLFFTFIQCF
jgi:hypothetical protein